MMYTLTRRRFLPGCIALGLFVGLLATVPKSPREICNSQHTPGTANWELCVHRLSI